MGRRRAFVVSAASNLKGGEADVRAVHAALCDPILGECNPNSSFARAGYTSAADFVKDFNEFLKDHKNEDQLIFYFSGHGRKVQDEYCLQIGADEDELHAFSEIRSKLKIKSVVRAILIIDACFSGMAAKSDEDSNLEPGYLPRGIVVLTSSSAYQPSYENKTNGQYSSVFTHLLVEAIETGLGGRKTETGHISVEDVQKFVEVQLRDRPELKAYGQHPKRAVLSGEADIWIARNKSGTTSQAPGVSSRPTSVSAYLERLKERMSKLPVIWTEANSNLKLSIDDAYTPLRIANPQRLFVPEAGTRKGDTSESLDTGALEEIFSRAGEYGRRAVMLLGEPGAGKSTAARKLAWLLASGTRAPQDLGFDEKTIPIVIRLADFESGDDIRKLLERQTGARVAAPEFQSPWPDLLRENRRLWVMDGLDEIADPRNRSDAFTQIRSTLEDLPRDYVLVTCRENAWSSEFGRDDEFLIARVLPLSPPQIQDYVRRWHRAVFTSYFGLRPESLSRAETVSESLLSILQGDGFSTPTMQSLCRNPLLLSVLCVVHYREGNDLPRRRAELYERCVTALLRSRPSPTGCDLDRFVSCARKALGSLAFNLHANEKRSIDGGDAAKLCGPALLSCGLPLDGWAFVHILHEACGILCATGGGQYGFLHLTFQEYFATQYILDADNAELIAGHLGNSWWNEVILLTVSKASSAFIDRFLRSVLESPHLESSMDALQACAEQIGEVGGDPYGPIRAALGAPSTPAESKLLLLRSFGNKPNAGIAKICTELVWQGQTAVAEFAREIIQKETAEYSLEQALREVSESENGADRALASWALRRFRSSSDPARWRSLLKDPDYRVRGVAAETVGSMGDDGLPAAERLLEMVQEDENFEVRAAARNAVISLGVERIEGASAVLQRFSETHGDPNPAVSTPCRIHIDARTRITLVALPGGRFAMGSSTAEDEQPIRDIGVEPFWMGRYPVTNEEYQRFLAETPAYRKPFYWDDRRFNQPDQPVVGVTWHDAQAFCKWAGFRLPTEIEWEYACRAGSTTQYCFGDREEDVLEYAWIDRNSEERTHRVGTRKANQWSLYDMHGNVWEWCADRYSYRYSETPGEPASQTGELRVLRGGTFFYGPSYCRSARREKNFPERRSYDFGFRVACDRVPATD